MEKKQSSIDWLIEKLDQNFDYVADTLIEQAKAMHKKEVEDAYDMGYLDYQNLTYDSAQEYYNETFGGQDNE